MKTSLKNLTLVSIFSVLALLGFSSPVFAACSEPNPTACAQSICNCQCVAEDIKKNSGCSPTNYDINNSILSIFNSILGVISIVAVIVIIIAGVRYMTAAGDSAKIKKAKDTLLYAIIGLIICALAAAIVNFVVLNLLKDVS